MKKSNKQLRKKYSKSIQIIRKIINQWDPIGVASEIDNEYDNYLPMIYKYRNDLEKLIQELENILINEIGLAYDPSNPVHKRDVVEVANKIFNAFNEKKE